MRGIKIMVFTQQTPGCAFSSSMDYLQTYYLAMNFLPFWMRIPLAFLLTRWPARLNTGASALALSAVMSLMPFVPAVNSKPPKPTCVLLQKM